MSMDLPPNFNQNEKAHLLIKNIYISFHLKKQHGYVEAIKINNKQLQDRTYLLNFCVPNTLHGA